MAAVEMEFDRRHYEVLVDLSDGRTWREHAVCKGRTNLFFPPKAERPQARTRREAQARLLCTTCPVQGPCQEFARSNHEYGFWGGRQLLRGRDAFGGFSAIGWRGLRAAAGANASSSRPAPIYEPEGHGTDYWRMARAIFAAGFRDGRPGRTTASATTSRPPAR